MNGSDFKVDAGQALALGGWSPALGAALREHRPASLELQAHVHDLAPFAGAVDSVEHLRLAGRAEDGRIDAITGLDAFAHLRSLEIRSPVRQGLGPAHLPHLERCALHWQAGCEVLSAAPSVESLVLWGYRKPGLAELPVSGSLGQLWLSKPAVTSLAGLGVAASLAELRITDARALGSLDGLEAVPLVSIHVETAPRLDDIAALGRSSRLRAVRLVGTSVSVDLAPLATISTLRRLHAGGPRMPPLDWPAMLGLPEVAFVSGGWDAAVADEHRLRASVPAGRRIVRFDPVRKRGVQPLVVEVANDGH